MRNETNKKTRQSTVSHLRGLMPTRQTNSWEAKRVAELQAYRLRSLVGDENPFFDMNDITSLPRIMVSLTDDLPASGSTHWQTGAWRIQIKCDETIVRQRFTLAHEFKHVLDAPLLDSIYGEIAKQIDGDKQIEAICDYFAACLLMPKRWVLRLWGEGVQDLDALAMSFDVSAMAMKRRLQDIGLIDRPGRSYQAPEPGPARADWFRTIRTRQQRGRFNRALPTPHLQEVA